MRCPRFATHVSPYWLFEGSSEARREANDSGVSDVLSSRAQGFVVTGPGRALKQLDAAELFGRERLRRSLHLLAGFVRRDTALSDELEYRALLFGAVEALQGGEEFFPLIALRRLRTVADEHREGRKTVADVAQALRELVVE